jgi:membrane-bound ClpP family serine protease
LCAIAGIVFAFRISTTTGVLTLGLVAVSTPATMWMAIKVFPYTPVGKRIILSEGSSEEEMQQRSSTRTAEQQALGALVGMKAMALTGLRPGGTIRIEGQDIEAFAETGFIDAGTDVVVASVRDRQVRVRPVSPNDDHDPSPPVQIQPSAFSDRILNSSNSSGLTSHAP